LAADLGWALKLGLPVSAQCRTLGQYLEHWLQVTEQRVRTTTWGSYRRDVERLEVTLGKVPLGRLSPHLVQVAYQRMRVAGLSDRSVERTHAALRRALNQAVAGEC
jgi:site-specific recombinase XerC